MKSNQLPTEFVPEAIEDFVGPARRVAERLSKSAQMCLPSGAAAAHLLVGPSGSGKSALAAFALKQFAVTKWNLTEIFGAYVTKEVVREIAFSMRLTNLYGGYRGYWFDEIDKASKEARDCLLEIVGDRNQARSTVIVATSNKSLADFDEGEKADAKGRFSSRWQVHEVGQPSPEDVLPLVKIWLTEADAFTVCQNAGTNEKGKTGQPVNTRALLKDVLTFMQQ